MLLAHGLLAAAALRRRSPAAAAGDAGAGGCPPADGGVAVVRPVYGLDAETEAALRSLLVPGVGECVFSFQDPDDAALPVARRLAAASGGLARVVVAPVEPGYAGKTSNLLHGVTATRAPVVILADADIVVPPGGLERLLAPLADPRVGAVACVPVCSGARGLWGRLYQAHLNAIIHLEWLPYAALGLPAGAPGATVAVRRAVLEAAGGIEALGGCVADDAELGRRITRAGHRLRAGPVVRTRTGRCDFARYRSVVERSAIIFGCTLPRPLFALHLLFNYAYLPALAVPAWRLPAVAYLAARCLLVAWVERDATAAPLTPLLDLTHLWLFAATLLRRRVTWRGIRYRLDRSGRVVPDGRGAVRERRAGGPKGDGRDRPPGGTGRSGSTGIPPAGAADGPAPVIARDGGRER